MSGELAPLRVHGSEISYFTGKLEGYLRYREIPYEICANAEAWKTRRNKLDVTIQGVPYRNLRTARYRVWCLERLRKHFESLAPPIQDEARVLLEEHGCWEPLWRVADPASGIAPGGRDPFARGHSMTGLR